MSNYTPPAFDPHQFFNSYSLPMSGTSLSWQDIQFIHQEEHKTFCARDSNPPSWAVNPTETQLLIVRYFERRAGILKARTGTPAERLAFAQEKAMRDIVSEERTLDRLCSEFVQTSDSKRRRKLQTLICGRDSEIIVAPRMPSIVAGVIFFYFRLGWDSKQVGEQLGISRALVRRLAHRLTKLWGLMQSGRDCKRSGRPKSAPTKRRCQADRTPEEQERMRMWWNASRRRRQMARAV
jgi:hypothetical protein